LIVIWRADDSLRAGVELSTLSAAFHKEAKAIDVLAKKIRFQQR
jgi:hypothetical protein